MKLYIKYMVSNRCKTIVKDDLEKIGVEYASVELGEVTIGKKITAEQHSQLSVALQKSGFILIDHPINDLIENLKMTISDLENYSDEDLKISYSDYISQRVKDSFISLNTLFAEIEGITIEKYIINRKIEKVKELLENNNLTLAEIALKMHYSNQVQLSSQFKIITGLTPSHYRQLRHISSINPDSN